jgi:hypothetical protein
MLELSLLSVIIIWFRARRNARRVGVRTIGTTAVLALIDELQKLRTFMMLSPTEYNETTGRGRRANVGGGSVFDQIVCDNIDRVVENAERLVRMGPTITFGILPAGTFSVPTESKPPPPPPLE